MHHAVDVVLEVFTWVGLGGALALGVLWVALWAADGTWLRADAIVDREGDEPVARWFDADGDANSATLSGADAEAVGDADTVPIWYRLGWRGRMRLHRRPHGLRATGWAAVGLLALGILCLVASWVLLFVGDSA
jgi:hypothetical protein